jgi:hypothetical protein
MLAALSSRNAPQPRLLGLACAAAALPSAAVFGAAAGLAGLLIAALVSFVVYLPLTALALNGGRPVPQEGPAPALTPSAQALLFALWTATAWLAAALARG